MHKAIYKWTPAVSKRKPDNITLKTKETAIFGFTPTYEKDEKENMNLLMSMEYMRIWFKERAVYEKDTYTRQLIIKEQYKIKRRFVQRMMTFKTPSNIQRMDEQLGQRKLKQTTKNPSSNTNNNLFCKYLPVCSRKRKTKNPDVHTVNINEINNKTNANNKK